jgi:hypothetical protein
MTQWWPAEMAGRWANRPWDTWFWDLLPGSAWGWPGAYYWFQKISPSEGHQQQLAIKSPVAYPWIANVQAAVKANVVYIITYQNDTPNWGGLSSLIAISPPCGNWVSNLYETPDEIIRSQTSGILAAIQADRDKIATVLAAVAMTGELECGITATIQGAPELDVGIRAAILGEATKYLPIKAAVRGEPELSPAIIAAVGKDFDLAVTMNAAVRGNTEMHCHLKAAVLGDTEMSVGIVAFVVKTRVDQILLEMENLWPQELDLRSTPNWASKVKDYRQSSLSARNS